MKYSIGQRVKMTENKGGYSFSSDNPTGYAVIMNIISSMGNPLYECDVEGVQPPSQNEGWAFFENELLPIEEEEEDTMKYKVGDVVKMNDKHPYCFDFWDVDGTMTIKEVHPWGLYACAVHGYPDNMLLNFSPEWIEGYATEKKEEEFKPGDIVLITGDDEDSTDHLDGKRGMVVHVSDKDCVVVVYSEILGGLMNWAIWKHNLTKC